MKIKIPSKVEDMRFQHLSFLLELGKIKEEGLEFDEIPLKRMRDMICSFTGLPSYQIGNLTEKSLVKLYFEIANTFEKDETKGMPLTIELDGKKYDLVPDFEKMPISWRIDVSELSDLIDDKPELIPAVLYIEKGMKYGQKDENKNVINSVFERAKVFKEHLPLDLFLIAQDFFLQAWKIYEPLKEADQLAAKLRRKRNLASISSTGK